jgi:beta-lactamase superfamily II metal-dependent hydrolase
MDSETLTLKFHVLNVQHGSSIVVDYESESGRYFGLVDCNTQAGPPPRAIGMLESLGAKSLSFICLTHPHKDHFSGLFDVIKRFDGNIGMFYFGDLLNNKARLKRLCENLRRLMSMSDGDTERKAALELIQIIRWASTRGKDWEECAGFESRIAPGGFESVIIKVLQPPRLIKGDIINRIERSDPTIIGNINDNNLSIALGFEYHGVTTILGGDSTASNWIERRRYELNTKTTPGARVVVLPHHGTRIDNTESIIDRLFISEGHRFALASANGLSHPSPEVIEDLSVREIEPYCTNLMPICGANVSTLLTLNGFNKEFSRFLREHSVSSAIPQVCQVYITVEMSSQGSVTVTPQFNHYCGFRSSGPSLFQ